ncbi:MAG: hypothetical protein EB015_02050 [Methylocystaceae bacterium]|nr:hypothetical protein [Methylocystaceae bacterium]
MKNLLFFVIAITAIFFKIDYVLAKQVNQKVSCPSEFDETECDSFQDGIRNGTLDQMTGVPNPFSEETKDSAIHAMPYIRGYELIRARKPKR